MSAATKPAADLGALHIVPSADRPASSIVSALSVTAAAGLGTNVESEAEALIAILADALEAIADDTSDGAARSIACEALAIFHGR